MPTRFNVADISRFHMDGDVMRVTAIARHPGVLQYRHGDGVHGELVTPLFLRKLDAEGLPIIRRLAGIPVTNEHPPFLFKHRQDALEDLQTGIVGNQIHVFKDGATQVTFETWDASQQTLIRTGEQKGVSLGYEVGTIPRSGSWDGLPFHYEQSEPFYADHLAGVRNPRANGALIKRFDSEDSDWAWQVHADGGVWDSDRRKSLESGDIRGAFAGTELSYPIASKKDVADAWIASYQADSEEQVRSNILAIAKEYGWADGLPQSAIVWAQERDIPLKPKTKAKTTTSRSPMSTVSMQFDGGVSYDIPSEAVGAITALRTKLDSATTELAQLRAENAKFDSELNTLREDAKKKPKDEPDGDEGDYMAMKEEMDALYDSYEFEKARADALEADTATRIDSDEVANRVGAYMDAIAVICPEAKAQLDDMNFNFDGKQSVVDIQRSVLTHLLPDQKFDDSEVPGAYKMALLSAGAAPKVDANPEDKTFKIVSQAKKDAGPTDIKALRAAKMQRESQRSRLSLSGQRKFDAAQTAL